MKYSILEKYIVPENVYDELFVATSQPREATRKILDRLKELGDAETEKRYRRLNYTQYYQSLIEYENEEKAVCLDSLPLCINEEEWTFLQQGISQRAKLYNLIAKDIYGEQSLIKEGIIPPSAVFANPFFLNMLWNKDNVDNYSYVNLMSVDIVRDTKGEFIAVNDKFQIPEGLGRALENRMSMARSYPELFNDLSVERLRNFFLNFRDSLFDKIDKDSTIVLLASEPEKDRRFEDAFLAKYLKLQLVDNDDLTIRNFNVYLKTLTGLKKVDIILRRIEDGMCDPLELKIDSGEGTVGLISAEKNGNVKIVNSLGTSILETPILRVFLPKISKFFLNEDLILKPVKAYWLGVEEDKNKILNNPENYMFYNAFNNNETYIYSKLTMTAQMTLFEKITNNPELYTAEEYIKTSVTPYLHNDNYETSEAHYRFYASYTQNKCNVMPGGYGWVETKDSSQKIEKDIWITSSSDKKDNIRIRKPEKIEISRAEGDLPSKAAENMFKLGKNLEDAEFLARILRLVSKRLADREVSEIIKPLPVIFASIMKNPVIEHGFENILWNLVMQKTENDGLQPICKTVRFLAVQLRDRISEDSWQILKNFGEEKLPEDKSSAELLPYLEKIIYDTAAVEGLISESMTRAHGWRFLDVGRRISRAIFTLKLIKNMPFKEPYSFELLTALLEIGDSTLTYFRRYGTKLHCAAILDLLICDDKNPHSVAYQAKKLEKAVKKLPPLNKIYFEPLDKEVLNLSDKLKLVDIYKLIENENALADFCEERIKEILTIEQILSREYLNHAPHKGIKLDVSTEV